MFVITHFSRYKRPIRLELYFHHTAENRKWWENWKGHMAGYQNTWNVFIHTRQLTRPAQMVQIVSALWWRFSQSFQKWSWAPVSSVDHVGSTNRKLDVFSPHWKQSHLAGGNSLKNTLAHLAWSSTSEEFQDGNFQTRVHQGHTFNLRIKGPEQHCYASD